MVKIGGATVIEHLLNKSLTEMHIVSGFEMKQKAKAFEERGEKVIHLEIGEPDFTTPQNIIDAAVAALQRGETHYAPALGIPALRQALSEYANKAKGLKTTSKNIMVTPGAKLILYYTFMGFVKPGDEVIIPNPGFPIYQALTKYMGATSIPLKASEENNFRITANDLIPLVTEKTKLIILNSPNNPTGAIMEKEELEKIAAFLQDKDVVVLSDEIYDRLYFTNEAPVSIASFPHMAEKTIILDGFSKTYAMTGWRLGYGIMPEIIAAKLNPLMVASNSCTNTFIQYAGIEALKNTDSEVAMMKASFKHRRDLLVNGLNNLPHVTCTIPDGAFYAFPNFRHYGLGSDELCAYMLENAFISSLPGSTFGVDLEGYLRFSFATSEENILEALNRLETALIKLKKRS